MKKLKDLPSTVFMVIGAIVGIIAVFFLFAPSLTTVTYSSVGGSLNTYSGVEVFWNEALEGARSNPAQGIDLTHGCIPAFVGYMLILVASVTLGVMAIPSIKPSGLVEKIVLGCAALCYLVGIVLVATIAIQFVGFNPWLAKNGANTQISGGTIGAVVLSLVSLGCNVFSIYLDW